MADQYEGRQDKLDTEIAELEAMMGEGQQPDVDPEAAVQQQQQQASDQEGDQQEIQYEEVITNVDEFIETTKTGEEQDQEQVQQIQQQQQVVDDQQPEQQVVEETQQGGRRSWKNDFLELENRYTKLRQANDHFKFETRQQLAQLQEELLQTKELNDKLGSKVIELETQGGEMNIASMFSEEDRDVLGETAIGSMGNALTKAVEAATAPLKQELLEMKKSERTRLKTQASTNRTEAYSTFERQLLELVPDFQKWNLDKDFINWLNEPSPFTGVKRLTHLHKAEGVGDVERVAQFFVEYKNSLNAPEQLLQQNVTPSGDGGGSAAPATAQQDQPGPKLFSMAFINKFYEDDVAGKYRGREALRDQLDREIDLAISDGRVR